MVRCLLSWLLLGALAGGLLWCSALGQEEPDADDADFAEGYEDSGEADIPEGGPSLPWEGESPHWSYGQEFSAVADAPFIGTAECLYCHTELKAGFLKTSHARSLNDDKLALNRQGCESCHGAGGAHAVLRSRGAIFAFDWENPQYETRVCLRCHEWLTTPEEWNRLAHAKAGLRCSDCHDPHAEPDHRYRFLLIAEQDGLCVACHSDVADDFSRCSRHPIVIDAQNEPIARALHCTDCHDVHAGPGESMLAEREVSEVCAKCHIEKTAPYRYTHPALDEAFGRGCLNCHLAHGSDAPWLAIYEGRELCMQCHTDFAEHYAPLTCYAAGCHVSIHGSNKSPLFLE